MDDVYEQATAAPNERRVRVSRRECPPGAHDIIEDSAGDAVCLECGAVWVKP
jgi:hypothetical protein